MIALRTTIIIATYNSLVQLYTILISIADENFDPIHLPYPPLKILWVEEGDHELRKGGSLMKLESQEN